MPYDDMIPVAMLTVLAFWTIEGGFAAYIATQRGASTWRWFILGLLFGPFALAASFVANTGVRCAYCWTVVLPEAVRCPYCLSEGFQSESDEEQAPQSEPKP